ncbi:MULTISPECIES: hypothetical protein [unclassified Streptomyces]|uniref:Uncharacterized protein n=1 Tax=Streptomyces sp. NBC_00060 TaxID=2975636 RepID=A0AAU2H6D7_9ACTN
MNAIEQPVNPAAYRRCEVCTEPGADVPTWMVIGDAGGDRTSYAHRGCAEATGVGEAVTP